MNRYKMRSMQPRDLPGLLKLHVEQNERDGTKYQLPRMFDEQGKLDTDIALAISMTRDDEAIQGVYFVRNRAVEMMFAGCSPRATLYSAREIETVKYTLRQLKYDAISCLVPHCVVPQLTGALEEAGFSRKDDKFARFYMEL